MKQKLVAMSREDVDEGIVRGSARAGVFLEERREERSEHRSQGTVPLRGSVLLGPSGAPAYEASRLAGPASGDEGSPSVAGRIP